MSEPRVFVAECALCHTKFTDSPAECPVCGGTAIRAIHEAVPAAKTIPRPALRKTPSPKVAKRRSPPKPTPKPTPPPETDYLSVPPRRLARPAATPRPTPPARPAAAADDIKARLTAAMAECREARRAYAAAFRRKSMAEADLRAIQTKLRWEAKTLGRKGCWLGRFIKTVIGLF